MEVEHYVLESIKGNEENPQSWLLGLNNKKLIEVDGIILEAAFSTQDNLRLLFTSDDTPFEETLHIILLDQTFNLLEQVDVYQEYQPGLFKNVNVIDENKVSFDFFENHRFIVEINSSPVIKLGHPFVQGPIRYKKKNLKCYLNVQLI